MTPVETFLFSEMRAVLTPGLSSEGVLQAAQSGRVYFSSTPKGYFRPTKLYTDYMSYTWQAPMPNAVFFIGGIAIHATTEDAYAKLGTRASGGCIRTVMEASSLIRKKIMETGRGDQPGQFRLVREGSGRTRVTSNSVSVSQLNRNTGSLLRTSVDSWDTVIVVYEE
jgi:hypothetical protein